MNKVQSGLLFAALLASTIIIMDILVFKNHAVERLAANIGVALLYASFYWRFFKRS